MKRLDFSPQAQADLLDITAYVGRDDPERARTFAAELQSRCAGLLEFPGAGRARPELAPGLRSKPHGSYVIFYTPAADVVRIERILHGARDLEAEFDAEES